MWQDYLLTFVIFMFAWCMIPQVKDVLKKKVVLNLWSAGITALGNYVCAIIWILLPTPLWVSVIASVSVGTIWLVLFVGSIRNMKLI